MAAPSIPIANPVPGGASYTSPKRAKHAIAQGRAELTADGFLFFFDAPTMIARREEQRVDRAIAKHRSGIVFWNGSGDPNLMHGPGEVRS